MNKESCTSEDKGKDESLTQKPETKKLPTTQGLMILECFLYNTSTPLSGADIARQTGLLSGTIYPILKRYDKNYRWLKSNKEKGDPKILGRPLKTFYRITQDGENAVSRVMKKISRSKSPLHSEDVLPSGGG
jgi:DNA-binding PadR family transcriptional regulator